MELNDLSFGCSPFKQTKDIENYNNSPAVSQIKKVIKSILPPENWVETGKLFSPLHSTYPAFPV